MRGAEKQDHPRLRGEKLCESCGFPSKQGSPPLTRGKDSGETVYVKGDRITPAYAGKSYSASVNRKFLQDHPRLRGEKIAITKIKSQKVGSPPLTRGKVKGGAVHEISERITPAYAGKRARAPT